MSARPFRHRATTGLFELQDELTQCVVAPVQTQLIVSEGKAAAGKSKPSGRVEDLLARARERLYQSTAERVKEQISLAEQALAVDPGNGEAYRLLAEGTWHQTYMGFAPWSRAVAERVMSFAQRAVVAEPNEYSQWVLGLAHLMAGEHERALVSLRRAMDINPNYSLAYGSTGTVLAWAGKPDDSVANNELALRINPGDPTTYHRYFGLALAHYLASRYGKALEYAALVVQLRPDWWLAHMIYSATLAQLGQAAQAQSACAEIRRVRPNMTVASLNTSPLQSRPTASMLPRACVRQGCQKSEASGSIAARSNGRSCEETLQTTMW